MSSILRQENKAVPPSELELLIFPELKNIIRDESELELERLSNFSNLYSLPPLKYDNEISDVNLVLLTPISESEFEKSEKAGEKKQRFLYYFFIRLLLNFSLISTQDKVLLKIVTYRDFAMEKLLAKSEDFLTFKLSNLEQYIVNLSKLESLIKTISSSFIISTVLKQPHLVNKNKYNLYYQTYFNKMKENAMTKHFLIKSDWSSGDRFRTITKYENFKIDYYKSKIDALLKDKLLFKHLIQGFFFTTPKKVNRKNLRRIYKLVARKQLFRLIARIIKKLVLRRKLLWLNIQINMVRHHTKFYLIGKDYKIYRKKIARTYISQTKKYIVNLRKQKRLNAKYIKCVEFFYDRKHMHKIRKVLSKIYKINLHLRYFVNRFASKLIQKKKRYYDSKFVVPINSKILSYNEILDQLLISKRHVKRKIFDTIIFSYKHHLEKRLLNNIQKKRQMSLEYFIRIMEKEKYYSNHRKTRFNPKLKKWLMKHVNDELNDEFREYFSRPRVILNKREDALESSYAYLPRKPLLFQRDLDSRSFRRKKFTKYNIIRLTKPWIVLQSQFFKYKGSNTISRNLLLNKLNHRLAVPERVERINRSCKRFYNNFLKDNSYQSFINLISKLKTFFLIKPELKRNPKFLFLYLLTSFVGPLFSGISEEREYANQLHTFLTHYLVRIRPYRRYDFTNLIEDLRTGYVTPKPYNLKYLARFFRKTKNIIRKRPNYTVMKFMHRRSLKRLTIRIRSKIAVARGLLPLFKYNLVATDACSPINIKKRFKNKGYHYLFQPDVNKKAKGKYKYYLSALKRTFGYSTTFHTNARLYYFSPFNLFLKNPDEINLALADGVAKYNEIIKKNL